MKTTKSLKAKFEQLIHDEPAAGPELITAMIELPKLAAVTGGVRSGTWYYVR